jgi:SAM-dependent methyltransferase
MDDPAGRRHARMRWNTPLSEDHAALLLSRLAVDAGNTVLDLGCGWGELLLRAVAAGGGTTSGTGVDTDGGALARGRALAGERSLTARVAFVEQPAQTWREPADRVLCVGSTHAFGGTSRALTALAELVRPGGRVLFGDAFWEQPPTAQALEIFGPDVLTLPALADRVRTAGWRVLHLSAADQREWDDFESTWAAGREEWLLTHPDDPRAADLRVELDERRAGYVSGYRGRLGLAYLVLAR